VPTKRNAAITKPAAPPGKLLTLSPGLKTENDLRGQEGNAGLEHGVGELLIDEMAVGRDVLRKIPGMHHDWNRRTDCDYYDNHRE